MSQVATGRAFLPLEVRRPRFEWGETPMHWVPGDPMTTHAVNTLHVLLPPGERWFVRVLNTALPLIDDPDLATRVRGFMGQEGVHAAAHSFVLDHLLTHDLDASPAVQRVDFFLNGILGNHRLPGFLDRWWLYLRLAAVASIEEKTATLARWVLRHDSLDRAGADPRMMDMLRWHASEEVEHQDVAFDVYQELCGNRVVRAAVHLIASLLLPVFWFSTTAFLVAHDHEVPRGIKWRMREYRRAAKAGLVPGLPYLAAATLRYMRPGHHPSQDGGYEDAAAYLARSPAAQSARKAS